MAADGPVVGPPGQTQFVAVLAGVAGWLLMPAVTLLLALGEWLKRLTEVHLSARQISASVDRLVGPLLRVGLSRKF